MTHFRQFALFVALLALLASGCSRAFYRRQADEQSYALIAQKANDARWSLNGDFSIEADPQSRMFDPFAYNDKPPRPIDDATSNRLMQYVDGKRGYPHWDDNGVTGQAEGPHWYTTLPSDPEKGVQLNQEDSLRLALLHSSNFQTQLEELYLSALDVTFERFRFDSQFFAGANVNYQQQASARAGTPTGSSALTTTATSPGIGGAGANVGGGRGLFGQRLTTTGATMVVGLANTIMWQYSGPDSQTAMSLLDFSIVQPLLRQAGRDRVMETLTQSERNLLANVRQMERFRKGFYIQVITGRNPGQGPQRGGITTFDGSANVGNAGGYIGLLQSQQIIRNQENNLAALRDNLALFEEFYNNGERINKLQVAQTRQALYFAQSRLLSSRTDYQTTLDGFKSTLGLPPQLNVCIEDDMLYRFQLISKDVDELKAEVLLLRLSQLSPQIDRLRNHISSDVDDAEEEQAAVTITDCSDLNNVEKLKKFFEQQESYRKQEEALRAGEAVEGVEMEKIPCLPVDAEPTKWTPDLKSKLQGVRNAIDSAHKIIRTQLVDKEGKEQPLLAEVRADVVKYCQCKTTRKLDLNRLKDVVTRLRDPCSPDSEGGYGGFDEQLFETERIDADFERVLAAYLRAKKSFEETATYLESIRDSIDDILLKGPDISDTKDLTLRICDEILFQAPDALLDFYSDTIGLSLVQARARTGCIRLLPVDIDPESAFQIACQNRLDWMNARAALVDSWRLIEFNADDLEANLDLVFEGDIGNVGNNPLRFRDTNSSLRAGLRFDTPITRLQERNAYRNALINYQRARRQYYLFRDSISATLRNEIRNINLNRVNFEIQREAILVAIEQVDQVRERLLAPPEAAAGGGGGQQLGPTTARDLVSAQNDLLNAQNTFMGLWVNYEVLRRSLDFDMGTLQLTPEGFWIDPGPIESPAETGQPTPADNVEEIPAQEPPLQGPQQLPPPQG